METNKIVGYVLLLAGLAMIIFSVYQSYNIFTSKVVPPLVFRTQLPKENVGVPASDLQKQMNESVRQQISQIIPAENITKILNLISWSLLAGILIIAGGTVAGLGIKMVR